MRTPRLVGALAILVVSLLTTAAVVAWIWNRADAVTPVDLPSAAGSPLPSVNPSVKPTTPPPPPPPQGRYQGGFLISHVGDRMPGMPGAWKGEPNDGLGLRGAALEQYVVHKDSAGEGIWFNYISFGTLNTVIRNEYKGTANLRPVTPRQAGIVMGRTFDEGTKPTSITRRPLTVAGRQAFEVVGRIAVKEKKVPGERFSLIAVTLVDRGDGTAAVAAAVFAGSQAAWLNVWRKQVQKIQIAR
jgi:hypothetical protein